MIIIRMMAEIMAVVDGWVRGLVACCCIVVVVRCLMGKA